MLNIKAYVIEIEADNTYKVGVDGIYSGVVRDNGDVDDHVTTFESALAGVVEMLLSNDYDIVERGRKKSRKGRPCRLYDVRIDDGD